MQTPTITTENNLTFENLSASTLGFFYPAVRIRSLIKNLDEELKTLSQQCQLKKLEIIKKPNSQTFPNFRKSKTTLSPPLYNMLSSSQLLNNSSNINHINNTAVNDSNAQLHNLASSYRSRVIEAYRNRKIFTIYGNYYTIRRALLRRGWLEKLPPARFTKLQNLSEETLLANAKRGNEFEAVAISKIINHFPAFFVWQPKVTNDLYADVHPYRNRVRRNGKFDFTTKVGLIGCGECAHWYTQDNVCRMSYPRCYRLKNNSEERAAFVDDFRQTQCRCLMRYVWENMTAANELVDFEIGTIEPDILKFALENLKQQMLEFDKVESAETKLDTENDIEVWHNFLAKSAEILRDRAKFRAPLHEIMEAARLGRVLLNKIEEHRPSYKWDGCRNLWILKPGFSCRGIGIIIRSSLDEIVHWVSKNPGRHYIAQKYIERPMLIYKTKFDIRQYLLLVIGANTVNIWLYRDFYLRFSSQEFSIDDLRESIHLTNNSVQKKYKSNPSRDLRLPRCNMWSLEQFRSYLKTTDVNGDVWNEKIYKGFKENLIAVVLASLEETDLVENAFELYGCDFMLDEHLNPILIEINSTPDLSPSTEVTARICPTVLRDLVKVIVDRPQNQSADTGLFEMIHEIDYKIKEDVATLNGLELSGHAMKIERQRMKRKPVNRIIPVAVNNNNKNVLKTGVQFIPQENLKSPKSETKTGLNAVLKKRFKASAPQNKPTPATHVLNKNFPTQQLQTKEKEALAIQYTNPR